MRLSDCIDFCALSWAALRSRWLRSALSIVGVAVGIVAFTVTAGISLAGSQLVYSELQTFGLRTVWISRDTAGSSVEGASIRSGSGIDSADVAVLATSCCRAVNAFTPVVYTYSRSGVRS